MNDSIPAAEDSMQWYVMRDLKRRNTKHPAYKMFEQMDIECFTPMVYQLVKVNGKREPMRVPFMQDLLFVKESRQRLDPIVNDIGTLQYRYKLGVQHTPMVVRTPDMERFIHAVRAGEQPCFFRPSEITARMKNRPIRIIGGPLDGYTGYLITTRGSRVKRLLVELPMILAATVIVNPEFIQLIDI